ncbi:amino acid transporter [Streptomyces viridochromogenes]|uniref:Amino acid transporter n=1 Tax=Streptomyces viridochromogenes TaxID=1938 RepID=A0A0J7Z8Y8_STRVR|nr:peptide MFS transporter [Streptomyces viridochromogenes]KMS72606.1 amino acid transporter [Streptomyces viridochromogenes]KOG19622.1 amino acid transporter [Streptomyces viridochromogenes]KOG23021.1 amino acid transporter [Streptomyces viridochromogenes]
MASSLTKDSASPGTPGSEKTFFGHPRGMATLFMTEMWERFSWYGMRAILTLYLIAAVLDGPLEDREALAASIYGVYNAVVYMAAMPGGWVADRLWGARKAVLVGGIVIAAGHFTLAIPSDIAFFCGLGLIAIGTGLLKPNISAMVGGLYEGLPSARRDAGFTLFYMAINIGGMVAPLAVGYLGENVNWHLGFGVAGVGMTLAVIQYVLGGRHLGDIGKQPGTPASPEEKRAVLRKVALWGGIAVAALVLDIVLGTYDIEHIVNVLAVLGIVVPIVYFVTMYRNPALAKEDKPKIQAFAWFFATAVLFWMIYDQSGSLLTIFADTKTDRMIGGWEFPASWYQSVNPAMVIVLAPIFAALWVRLAQRNREPSTPMKFALAMLLIGGSFGIMGLAGAAAANSDTGKVTVFWLLSVYLAQTLGEMCLSPVGLSLSTKLAPKQFVGQIMGLWFLATATGNALNGWTTKLNAPLGDAVYYTMWGVIAVAAGLAFMMAGRKIRALMGNVR